MKKILVSHFFSASIFVLTLLSAPTVVMFIDLFFFADSLSKETAENLFPGRLPTLLPELFLLGTPSLASGATIWAVLATIARRFPEPSQLTKIVLAQYPSIWMAIVALSHNPQEEFCVSEENGLLITNIYAETPCNPSIELAMLQLAWSFVFTFIAFVISSVFRKIYTINRGEK